MMDLSLRTELGKLNIRVAAWIEQEGKLLVCKFPDGHISLPGGRVKFNETTIEAIQRELNEELESSIENPKLSAVIENFFELDTKFHELLFVYKGQLSESTVKLEINPNEQTFSWLPLSSIHSLKPTCLQELIVQSGDTILHLINKDSSL